MIKKSGGQLTAKEVAGIKASPTPITAANPAASQADIDGLALSGYTEVSQASSGSFSVSGVTEKTKYIGDTRGSVGHTWINRWDYDGSNSFPLILPTASGFGAGYFTIAIDDGTKTVTLTGSTTNPSLSSLGILLTDKAIIVTNNQATPPSWPVVFECSIVSKGTNTFVVDFNGMGSGGAGYALCFKPTTVLNGGGQIVIAQNQDLYFKGCCFTSSIKLLGKATFENCLFYNTADTYEGLVCEENSEVVFVGYCNSFIESLYPLRNRGGTITGQFTVAKSSYSTPTKFNKSAIDCYTGGKVISKNSRAIWTTYGIHAEPGALVNMDDFVCLYSHEDGILNRGGKVHAERFAHFRARDTGFNVYTEKYGVTQISSAYCKNSGGSASFGNDGYGFNLTNKTQDTNEI